MEKTLAQIRAENGKLGGRPLGTKNKLTILKEKKRADFDKSIALMAKKITNAQAIVALGNHKMIRMFKDADGTMHIETIKDETRMQNLLDTGVYGVDYIIVVGHEPDWKAGDALLNRVFGKATETVKHEGEIGFSLKALKDIRDNLKAKAKDITDDQSPAPSQNLLEASNEVDFDDV